MADDPLRVALANFTHNMRVSHDRKIAFREERGVVPSEWAEGMDAGEESVLAGLEYLVGLYPPSTPPVTN